MTTTTEPAGVDPEPLMAGIVQVKSRDAVVWPVRMLRVDDAIRISALVPHAVIVDNQPAEAPVLRTLTLNAVIDSIRERITVTVPVDTEYALISAVREAWPKCRVCQRPCLHLYDAADSTPPHLAICVECDRRITAEVRAETLDDAAPAADTKEEAADADRR